MPHLDSRPRTQLGWAAVKGYATQCAAQLPECSTVSQPSSRVNLDRTAGPEPGDNPVLDPHKTARRAGDELPAALPIHQLRLTARWRKPNGSHQLRGG